MNDLSRAEMLVEYKFQTRKEAFYFHLQHVLAHRFDTPEKLDEFYEAIPTNEEKFLLLSTCASYRYMVKDGDWVSKVNGIEQVVDYITDSHKLLTIFALIESLSNLKHVHFQQWLKNEKKLPILDEKHLNKLNDEYLLTYGSIKKVVAFFERLSDDHQAKLCNLLTKQREPMDSIKRFAQFLYNMRSQFAHEGKLSVGLQNAPTIKFMGKDSILIEVKIEDVMEAFELGLISRFTQRT
ncbi:hypothetical protein [Variovorax sp. RA8]|uniref:hypothetical protein n=1 Tax=Variovorax sp. (strain JCM 16519 / RA8) TaxID=662548 RepID=UPI0013A59598|nr:hypothetical protein [Variovorax sp. RA8]